VVNWVDFSELAILQRVEGAVDEFSERRQPLLFPFLQHHPLKTFERL